MIPESYFPTFSVSLASPSRLRAPGSWPTNKSPSIAYPQSICPRCRCHHSFGTLKITRKSSFRILIKRGYVTYSILLFNHYQNTTHRRPEPVTLQNLLLPSRLARGANHATSSVRQPKEMLCKVLGHEYNRCVLSNTAKQTDGRVKFYDAPLH